MQNSKQNKPESKKRKYRKDKPWDLPTIDKWKIPKMIQQDQQRQYPSFLEQSSFATLFPQYRQKYIRESFPTIKKTLAQHGIKIQMNLTQGSLTVRTTDKTIDPYAIIQARDIIKLIARSVPAQHALRLLQDGNFCDIIKIRSFVRNTKRFVKRRQRLIGPNGATLKALQLLTNCYILVQGSTVSVIGKVKDVKVLRRIIVDTMNNIHPIYHIKQLMIKRELAKDQKLKNQNWQRFLPQFKSLETKRKIKRKTQKKQYQTLPPEQMPRKQDILMQTGQYFLSKQQKQIKQKIQKKQRQQENSKIKQKNRLKQYQDPGFYQQIQRQQAKKRQKKISQQPTIDQLKDRFLKGNKKVKLFNDK